MNSAGSSKIKIIIAGFLVLVMMIIVGFKLSKSEKVFRDISSGQDQVYRMLHGVDEVHIFVFCNIITTADVPPEINLQRITERASQDIKHRYYSAIKFSDGQIREPIVTKHCGLTTEKNGLNALNDGHNLNFVINIYIFSEKIGEQQMPVALVSQTVFRPDLGNHKFYPTLNYVLQGIQAFELSGPDASLDKKIKFGWTFIF